MKKIILLFTVMLLSKSITYAQSGLPSLVLNDLEGKKVNLSKDFLEKDKIYIMSFWATWCAPCIAELDEINDVYADWKKELNVEVIAVSIDDVRTQKRVKPLANGKGWEYRVLLDTNQDFKRALNIVNPPHTIVVKNGVILHSQNGYSPGSEEVLYKKIKSL
ncbi:MAG: TlpA disulfide reductase family protein [Limnohabitans sp.]|nr:TlpA disulfide reductase family protein [Limnohabitans sp.]